MCKDRELAHFERVETSSKTFKTCVLHTAEFAFIKSRYSFRESENITKTPHLTILIDLLKYKQKPDLSTKLDLYRTRNISELCLK